MFWILVKNRKRDLCLNLSLNLKRGMFLHDFIFLIRLGFSVEPPVLIFFLRCNTSQIKSNFKTRRLCKFRSVVKRVHVLQSVHTKEYAYCKVSTQKSTRTSKCPHKRVRVLQSVHTKDYAYCKVSTKEYAYYKVSTKEFAYCKVFT